MYGYDEMVEIDMKWKVFICGLDIKKNFIMTFCDFIKFWMYILWCSGFLGQNKLFGVFISKQTEWFFSIFVKRSTQIQ